MLLNLPLIFRMIGLVTMICGISMLPSCLVAFAQDDDQALRGFLLSAALVLGFGILLYRWAKIRTKSDAFRIRDGYLSVSLCWIIASLAGALPYYFSGTAATFIDGIFESAAAFTTTGATTIGQLPLPASIALWKALSHWLGGMGILVFAIAILPALGASGLKIVSAETPGPAFSKVKNKISESTKTLYKMYLAFTIAEFLLLLLGGMPAFDAVINTLGSISTSGLASNPGGIAAYDSFYIESVITLFTFLASINFLLFYMILQGKWSNALKDTELRVFVGILAAAFALNSIALLVSGACSDLPEAMRLSIFQTVAFSSTSGYFLSDYTLWPAFSQTILFFLMIMGGCASSTCGSFKIIRVIILFKLVARGFRKRLHPRSVVAVRIGSNVIPADTVSAITSFTMFYITIYFFTALVMALDNLDMTTTLSAAAGILSNTGLAFGDLGPSNNFSIFSPGIRLFSSFMMIVGRLELFTVLILFTPRFWTGEN